MDDETKKHVIDWNRGIEKETKSILDNCYLSKMAHLSESVWCERTHTILMLIGIVIGPVSGTLIGIDEYLNPETDIRLLPILASIISYIGGIIIAIVKFGKFDDLSNRNKKAYVRYISIENDIRDQLSMSRKDRRDAIRYLRYIRNKVTDVIEDFPIYNRHVDKYEVQLGSEEDSISDNEDIKLDKDVHVGNRGVWTTDPMASYEIKRLNRI